MRELPEIVLVCVNRLSRGKFPGLNIHGYVKNKTKKAPMTFNVVISEGVLPPTVRQPITKLQLTKNLFIIKGLISAFLSEKHQKNNTFRSVVMAGFHTIR